MSLTSNFLENPETFLETTVMIVPSQTDEDVGSPKLHEFVVKKHGSNSALLVPSTKDDVGTVKAYYLPWAMSHATSMDLGDAADFFFTSEMTNCRFSILADDPKKPKVAHVAGNTNKKDRDTYEVDDNFVTNENKGRARRFSVSQGSDPTKDFNPANKFGKTHQYVGQRFGGSSAFVFGHRIEGTWKFYAQVVKGSMASPSDIVMDSDLTILKFPKTGGVLHEL